MIKHCLGNSQINSIPAWSKEFSYITFLYRTIAKVYALARADITHSHREIKEIFDLKTHPFINQEHKSTQKSPGSLFPAIAVKNPQKNLAISQYLIPQRDNIHARNRDTCVDIGSPDGAICSKNRNIVPYHGSARIPGLTVSVPDYGSRY